jgi:hypothetical protein
LAFAGERLFELLAVPLSPSAQEARVVGELFVFLGFASDVAPPFMVSAIYAASAL